MPVSDLDIHRSVHLWIQQHRDQAIAKAREMVEQMRRKGDVEGADTRLRIIIGGFTACEWALPARWDPVMMPAVLIGSASRCSSCSRSHKLGNQFAAIALRLS